MGFLIESQDEAELQLKLKQMRAGSDKLIPSMLEHVAIALWGSCAVLEREKQLGRLSDDVSWIAQAAALAEWNDARCDSCVSNAGAGILAITATSLAEALLEQDATLLTRMLTIIEDSPQIQVSVAQKCQPPRVCLDHDNAHACG